MYVEESYNFFLITKTFACYLQQRENFMQTLYQLETSIIIPSTKKLNTGTKKIDVKLMHIIVCK